MIPGFAAVAAVVSIGIANAGPAPGAYGAGWTDSATGSGNRTFDVAVCAFVEAPAASWPEIAPDCEIDPSAISWRRKAFLGSSAEIPVASPVVRKALAEAVSDLSPAARLRTVKVLDAVAARIGASVSEESRPWTTPSSWRPADEVIRSGHGNEFERVRALVALLRAAGIPAKPAFNGVPVVLAFAAQPGQPGAWTVWDPFHPAASFRVLPVAWAPLRAGDVPLLVTQPAEVPCTVSVEVRRWTDRGEAGRAWETVARLGGFPSNPEEVPPVASPAWWEIWITRVSFPGDPGAVTLSVPLPFSPEHRYGARDQAVWLAEPSRLKSVDPWSETDQRLGGLLHGLRVRIAAPGRK